ncbi:hypothetical protein [Variovorax sp. Sphag1AA]|uniref:hypothetical protein n=1 Tax=Variovorax sp. Sphag1AA TaxID=2587027 RepID=UPI001608EBEF|nr:hypothetical protein [Variovorax sp. Sphag1AA]MBB3175904.1 hypothetical protein [Variovorax sp. Sphag1AA]
MQTAFDHFRSQSTPRRAFALAALAGVVLLSNAFAVHYVLQERAVYFWDWAGYWIRFIDVSSDLLEQPLRTLRGILVSIRGEDYNSLVIVPLIPMEWVFGPGRLAYVLAIVNMSLLPSAFMLAWLPWRGLPPRTDKPLADLALATACVATMHVMWIPVLRGLPDILGLFVIGLVLRVHFSAPLAEQKMRQLITTGLLLCLLVLVRRWYLFWVVSFFPALALAQGFAIHRQDGGLRWRSSGGAAHKAIIIGLTFAGAMAVIATPLVLRILRTDYADIYSAYRYSTSITEVAQRLFAYFGWSLLACGLVGLVLLWRRQETRTFAIFLLVQPVIIFCLFARTQDFGVQHYYLLTPSVGIGIAALVLWLCAQIRKKIWTSLLALALVFVCTIAGSLLVFLSSRMDKSTAASVLAFSSTTISNASSPLGALVTTARFPPMLRNDLAEFDRLLSDVVDHGKGTVYVVASSTVLNSNMMAVACRTSGRPPESCARLLPTKDVDKRDGFPHGFVRADTVLVAVPTQYHLRPEDQQVIGLLARDMTEGRGVGAAFRRLPNEYRLENGVAVYVYARSRAFEPAELQALSREFIEHYPGLGKTFSEVE